MRFGAVLGESAPFYCANWDTDVLVVSVLLCYMYHGDRDDIHRQLHQHVHRCTGRNFGTASPPLQVTVFCGSGCMYHSICVSAFLRHHPLGYPPNITDESSSDSSTDEDALLLGGIWRRTQQHLQQCYEALACGQVPCRKYVLPNTASLRPPPCAASLCCVSYPCRACRGRHRLARRRVISFSPWSSSCGQGSLRPSPPLLMTGRGFWRALLCQTAAVVAAATAPH